MPSNLVMDNLIAQLDPAAIEHYAEVTGWHRVANTPPSIAVFQRGGTSGRENAQQIIVPRDRSFADFYDRLAESVEVLSKVEKRSTLEMLSSVQSPLDILRFRVVSPETANGLLPLLEGVDLYSGMKRTILAAACDFIKPQAYHPRLVRKEAEEYLKGCLLGQTMPGSYIATVLCPVNPPLKVTPKDRTSSLFPEFPTEFYRSVTSRVMHSLETISTRLDQGDAELLIRPGEKDLRISGNFFEALTEMQPEDRPYELQVSVSWSHAIASVPETPSEVTMLEKYFPELQVIADQLRPDFQPQDRSLVGKVIALYGDQNEDDLMEGQVIIRFLDDDTLTEARVALQPKDYEVACDAHKLGKYVEIYGRLARLKRRYVVTQYRFFEALPFFTAGTDVKKKYVKKAQENAKRRRAQL